MRREAIFSKWTNRIWSDVCWRLMGPPTAHVHIEVELEVTPGHSVTLAAESAI
jgi:hypothetical protein